MAFLEHFERRMIYNHFPICGGCPIIFTFANQLWPQIESTAFVPMDLVIAHTQSQMHCVNPTQRTIRTGPYHDL